MSSRLSAMREPADDPEHRLTLRQADQARADLYATADELESLKVQRAAFPDRAYVSRLALMATGSVWALIVAVAMILAR